MFSEKLSLVPELPGSYQMKDKDGNIIYVGKAKNLKRRLRSYFNRTQTGKTKVLVENIHDFEYIVTASELESLVLEITLIKKYNPKYNILLKDGKSYPYIELENSKCPTLKLVRNVKNRRNKNNLYGPFPNVGAAKNIVNMLNRVYPLRKCEHLKKELCLYYHIGECLGYCSKDIDQSKVDDMINEIKRFLNGDKSIIKNRIKELMDKESNSLNFEKALEYKNMLNDIDVIIKDQNIILNRELNFDLFNCYQSNNYLSIETLFIRNGIVFGRSHNIINNVMDIEDAFIEYIVKFYENNIIPKEIIVPEYINTELLSSYLNTKVNTKTKGDIKKILDMAYNNAKINLENREIELTRNEDKRIKALNELKELLHIDRVSVMESFDNSHLFGTYYVSGMVVFKDFLPDRNSYRKFKIDAKDDLNAMREVIYRRYFRLMMEEKSFPDLLVIDGGINQVRVVKEVLDSLNLKINIIGLKKDDKHNTNSIIDSNLNEIIIDSHSDLFLYLANIQEEVHRFAISYHRELRSKGAISSVLDNVKGIGDKRKKMLLKRFSSVKKIKEASMEELNEILPPDISKELYDYLKSMV